MKIKIIVVDRTRQSFLREGESFYLDRIRRYAALEWVEVKAAKISKGRPEEEVLKEEGESLLKRVSSSKDYTVALDRSGRHRTSEQLASFLEELSRSVECLAFLIGGPLGLSREVLGRCREALSLSPFTLTHEMSRLVLLEQIYRAFTIVRGEKYHK